MKAFLLFLLLVVSVHAQRCVPEKWSTNMILRFLNTEIYQKTLLQRLLDSFVPKQLNLAPTEPIYIPLKLGTKIEIAPDPQNPIALSGLQNARLINQRIEVRTIQNGRQGSTQRILLPLEFGQEPVRIQFMGRIRPGGQLVSIDLHLQNFIVSPEVELPLYTCNLEQRSTLNQLECRTMGLFDAFFSASNSAAAKLGLTLRGMFKPEQFMDFILKRMGRPRLQDLQIVYREGDIQVSIYRRKVKQTIKALFKRNQPAPRRESLTERYQMAEFFTQIFLKNRNNGLILTIKDAVVDLFEKKLQPFLQPVNRFTADCSPLSQAKYVGFGTAVLVGGTFLFSPLGWITAGVAAGAAGLIGGSIGYGASQHLEQNYDMSRQVTNVEEGGYNLVRNAGNAAWRGVQASVDFGRRMGGHLYRYATRPWY